MPVDERLLAIADQLLLLEHELRSLNLWRDTPPTEQELNSQQPFCVDTLSFDQWLQWLFLPRLQQMVAEGKVFSGKSAMRSMGEVVWRERMVEARPLLDVLGNLDGLISYGQLK